MITAKEIRSKKFRLAKGYDKEEVDEFLSNVSDEFSKLTVELSELNSKYETLSKALTYYKELENALQKTMVIAQKNADDTLTTAKNNAKITIDTANKTATDTLEAARQSAKAAIDAANNTGKQIVLEATKQSDEIIAISNDRAAKTISNANKTATTTLNEAAMKAASYEEAAREKAIEMLTKASSDYNTIKNMTRNLIAEYENYKAQFKNLAMMQFDLINGKAFDINLAGLKAADENFNVELDFDSMYEQYKNTHFNTDEIVSSVEPAQVEYAQAVESAPFEPADYPEPVVEEIIAAESEDTTGGKITVTEIHDDDVINDTIESNDESDTNNISDSSDNNDIINSIDDIDNINDILEKISDIDFNDEEPAKDNSELDAIKDIHKIDGLEDTAVNPPVSNNTDSKEDDTFDDLDLEDKIADNTDNYNILFKAQTSTKNRPAVNTFDDEIIDNELAEDDFDENAYSALDNAFNNMLDKVLADAENDVPAKDDFSFDDDDFSDEESADDELKEDNKVAKEEKEDSAKSIDKLSNDTNDTNDTKESNMNIGISFSSSDDSDIFSEDDTEEDDDEFIFDDTDDNGDDSIGITFDFLDK